MAATGAMIASGARTMDINMVTWSNRIDALIAMLGSLDFEVAIMGVADVHPSDPWTLMRGDPDYLADQFHSRNSAAGRNLGGFSDGPFDSIVTLSRHEINPVARTSDVKAAEGILADRGPVIPMYYRTSNWAYRSDRFTGWHLIASTIFNYWSLQDLDSTMNVSPQIVLMSPTSGSLIRPGTPIDLDVRDTDLVSVEYSVDGVPPSVLPAPYDLSTDSWADGNHLIAVRATDPYTETIAYYPFRVDGTPPRVLAVSPTNGSVVPAGRISLKVTFSEAVNRTSVEAGFSLFVGSTRWGARDGTFAWAANSTSFRFNTTQAVPESATLEVRLTENLTDTVGNPMGTEYAWQFTTPLPPLAVAAVFAGIAAVGIVAVLIVLLVAMRLRKKRPLNPQP